MRSLSARPQPAPTAGTTQRVSATAVPPTGSGGAIPERPRRRTRISRLERRVLVVAGAMFAGVLGAAVLAGSLSDAMTARAALAQVTRENAAISAQVDAARAEVGFAGKPAFLGFTSRAYGFGRAREQAFALQSGGPPPPSIEPLGTSELVSSPRDPLGAVMDLLFDR